jgi:dGTPase
MANYHNLSKELQERIQVDRTNHWQNPYAFKNEDVIRRDMQHDKQNLWRPSFVRDCEKIMNVPFYNRYSDKTQVFSLYKNDDISRRAYHVQLVSRIARNIGSILGLNIDLIEAISLGHDLGHTPFGHAGERKLNELYNKETGRYFNHNVHSVRVLDKIFPLNMSLQTLDGIMCHNGEMELEKYQPQPYMDFTEFDKKVENCYIDKEANRKLIPATLEGCVMRVSDIIAYLGKDRQDAMRVGILDNKPNFKINAIGTSNAEIINNMIVNIVENSYGKPYLKMDKEFFEAFSNGKKENYEMIYGNSKVNDIYEEHINPMMEDMYYKLLDDAQKNKVESMLYKNHVVYMNSLTQYYRTVREQGFTYKDENLNDLVVDYIASMTDDYFVEFYQKLYPNSNHKVEYIGYFE